MDTYQSDIVKTTLNRPATQDDKCSLPDTPLTTISKIVGPSEALQHESESRQYTTEISQQRAQALPHEQSGIDVVQGRPESSARGRSRINAPTAHYVSRIKKRLPAIRNWSGAVQSSTSARGHNTGYVENPKWISPTGPRSNQNMPFTPSYQRHFPDIAETRAISTHGVFGGHRSMTKSMSEDEYDKSRGAYFTHLPPTFEMKIGQPSKGTAAVSRNDIMSMRAEVTEVGALRSDDHQPTMILDGKMAEEGAGVRRRSSMPSMSDRNKWTSGEGRENEQQRLVDWSMERRMKDVEERMGRMEEKLDRVLELLEGVPGPAMVSGGVDGWWKEVKEEM